jgi:hypothetical protein
MSEGHQSSLRVMRKAAAVLAVRTERTARAGSGRLVLGKVGRVLCEHALLVRAA